MKTINTAWKYAAILIVATLPAQLPAAAADTMPPIITVSSSPTSLWPPDGRMVPVKVSGTIADDESGVNADTAKFTVYDPEGTVQPSGQVTVATDGSFSFTVLLQASRKGTDLAGRHYSITVRASDNAGNPGFGSATVVVPHDQDPLPAITSITVCTLVRSGPPGALRGNCPEGTVDSIQPVVGPDGATSVNSSLNVAYAADEHSSVFPPNGLGTNQDYLFFLATEENHNPGIGMAVLSGGAGPDISGKWTFHYPVADANGSTSAYGSYKSGFAQVFNSPHHPGECPLGTRRLGQRSGPDLRSELCGWRIGRQGFDRRQRHPVDDLRGEQ